MSLDAASTENILMQLLEVVCSVVEVCYFQLFSPFCFIVGDSFSLECTGSTRNVFLNTSGILVGCVTWSPDALPCIRKSSLDRSILTYLK